MTPKDIENALDYAIGQEIHYEEMGFTIIISEDTPAELVNKVREYFNENEIEYETFGYEDLKVYL